MLAAILAEDDSFARVITYRSRIHKFSVVRYRDPVKFADNLPELRPNIIVVRERDFPLHWQLLLTEVAFLFPTKAERQSVQFVLFTLPDAQFKAPKYSFEAHIPDSLEFQDAQYAPKAGDPIRLYSSLLTTLSHTAPAVTRSQGVPPSSFIGRAEKHVGRH